MSFAEIAIIGVTAFAIISDIWLYLTKRETYSQAKIKWSKAFMIVPFAWGFLMGHWFG